MKTLSNQYKLIKEGKGSKDGFLRNAKRQFPNHVPNHATYDQAAKILKQKGIISENFVGSQMIGGYAKQEKQGYEKAFENFSLYFSFPWQINSLILSYYHSH